MYLVINKDRDSSGFGSLETITTLTQRETGRVRRREIRVVRSSDSKELLEDGSWGVLINTKYSSWDIDRLGPVIEKD